MAQTPDRLIDKKSLERDMNELFPHPDEWRHRRHELLGGKTPDMLLDGKDTDRERLRDLLEAIRHGMVS